MLVDTPITKLPFWAVSLRRYVCVIYAYAPTYLRPLGELFRDGAFSICFTNARGCQAHFVNRGKFSPLYTHVIHVFGMVGRHLFFFRIMSIFKILKTPTRLVHAGIFWWVHRILTWTTWSLMACVCDHGSPLFFYVFSPFLTFQKRSFM